MPLKSTRPLPVDAQGQHAARGFGLISRRLIPAGLVGIVASLAFVASAQAGGVSVTQSTITSPSDPYFALNQNQQQSVTIAGTTDPASTDNVDIDCYPDGSSGTELVTVAANVMVTNHTFSTTVPINALDTGGPSELCRLRAVDTNGPAPTTGLSAFTGPRTAFSYLNHKGNHDFNLFVQQLTASDDYNSLGECGLDDSYSQDATGAQVGYGFGCNDWTDLPAQSDDSASGITVDGEPAYAPASAYYSNSGAAGLPAVTVNSVTQDPVTGDVTLVETEPIVFCADDLAVADVGSCTTFVSAGIQDIRTITQTDDGHVVTIHDAFSSSDASAHSVDLLLENDQYFGNGSDENGNQDFLFPGQSSWVQPTGGESETMPAGDIDTIYVRNVNVPNGSPQDPLGAITYFRTPTGPLVFGSNSNGNFDAPVNLSVPATGSAVVDYAYATDTSVDSLNNDVAGGKDAVEPPAVTIASPSEGATVSTNPVPVAGTASAGSGVQGLTVDGSPVAVASDGIWTTSLTPVTGAQTITVTLTSQAGNTANAHQTLTYTPLATTATTSTSATPSPSPPAGIDQTTASRKVRSRFAVLGGTVAAHAGTVTYRFQYGPTSAYGRTTGSRTLPASTGTAAVGVAARRLVPGSTYHYRLVVADSAGQISYGSDMVVRTPRIKPRRVRDHITAYWARHAPYGYVLDGRLVLPHGLSKRVACATGGVATVTITRTGHTIAQRRLKLTAHCTYHTALSFTAAQLPGSGTLKFQMRFGGNRPLRGRPARTLNVLYGPRNVTR